MTLFSMSCHNPVHANVPCCEYFHFISNIHDKSSFLWRFKCYSAMNQVQQLAVPCRSYDVIIYDVIAGHENIYVNNSSDNRGRAVSETSLYLSCTDASTDMQFDLPGSFIRSGSWTRHKVKFSAWTFGVRCIWFDASRQEKYYLWT